MIIKFKIRMDQEVKIGHKGRAIVKDQGEADMVSLWLWEIVDIFDII